MTCIVQLNILHITRLFIYLFIRNPPLLFGRQSLKLMELKYNANPKHGKDHSAFVQCAQIMQCSPTLIFSIKRRTTCRFTHLEPPQNAPFHCFLQPFKKSELLDQGPASDKKERKAQWFGPCHPMPRSTFDSSPTKLLFCTEVGRPTQPIKYRTDLLLAYHAKCHVVYLCHMQ